MIDVAFQLITFFVMLMTIAKDEQAQKVRLPQAPSAAILEDDLIPDALSINVAVDAKTKRPELRSWGVVLDLSGDAGWSQFRKLIRNEAAIAKGKPANAEWKKKGLSTTLIIRVDWEVDYEVFRKVIEVCQQLGFNKFQLKAAEEEET